jgi:hypothetical protein
MYLARNGVIDRPLCRPRLHRSRLRAAALFNLDSKLIYPCLCRISSHNRYFPGYSPPQIRQRTRLCGVTQSILARDTERFHHLAISSYPLLNSEVRYRIAPNFCSTISSLALRRARVHIDRENRCQSPSRCCRMAEGPCCSCKRDRRGKRSALSSSGPSSAQVVAERFGTTAPGNRCPGTRKSNRYP